MTLKAIWGYDGNIYGNGGTVEFGLLFSELDLAWTRKSRVPFQWDTCRMLQSFVRIYHTSSLIVFKYTSPVLQFWCHNLQTFIDGQIRCHHPVSLSRYASRKMKPYAAYILQGVHVSRVLIIIKPWSLDWAANDHFCGDDDQRIEDPSHRHSRVRRPLLWNFAFQGKIQSSTFVQHFLSASSRMNDFDCINVKVFEP